MAPTTITVDEFSWHKFKALPGAVVLPGAYNPGAGWHAQAAKCGDCGLTVRTWDKVPPGYGSPIICVEPPSQGHVHERCGRRSALLWLDALRGAKDDATFAEVWKTAFADAPWEKLGRANAEDMCRTDLGIPLRAALGRVASGELSRRPSE